MSRRFFVYFLSMVPILIGLLAWRFYRTQTEWVTSGPYERKGQETAKTLIVAYSRTGDSLGKDFGPFLVPKKIPPKREGIF